MFMFLWIYKNLQIYFKFTLFYLYKYDLSFLNASQNLFQLIYLVQSIEAHLINIRLRKKTAPPYDRLLL